VPSAKALYLALAWLQHPASQVPPETLLGKAVSDALVRSSKLLRYLDHPAMTPDAGGL